MSFFQSVLGIQLAVVVDNKDPDQAGKVKVSFTWDDSSVQTAWASVLQPMAGNAYGVYFVPEVNDFVMIGFLHNNHATPIVMGSIYTGSANQGANCYDADNYIKNIKTKGGNEIKFTDKKGEETITITNTTNGNQIALDMKDNGSVTISSPYKIEMVAPEIILNGGQILFKGGDIKMNATPNWSGKPVVNASFESKGDIIMDAQNDIRETAFGDGLFTAQKTNSIEAGQGLSLKSDSGDLKLAALNIQATAQVGITLKGSATAELSASGQTTVKGAMVMIN